jgi:hypothetical protein
MSRRRTIIVAGAVRGRGRHRLASLTEFTTWQRSFLEQLSAASASCSTRRSVDAPETLHRSRSSWAVSCSRSRRNCSRRTRRSRSGDDARRTEAEVERKNQQIEDVGVLRKKAELALTSRYASEILRQHVAPNCARRSTAS